jgi:hypothetical protein
MPVNQPDDSDVLLINCLLLVYSIRLARGRFRTRRTRAGIEPGETGTEIVPNSAILPGASKSSKCLTNLKVTAGTKHDRVYG